MMKKLYEAVERAVINRTFIRFPCDIDMLLVNGAIRSRGIAANGMTYTIDGIYWMDEKRNIYSPLLQYSFYKESPIPELKVIGTFAPDGLSSGITSMIKKENRYHCII